MIFSLFHARRLFAAISYAAFVRRYFIRGDIIYLCAWGVMKLCAGVSAVGR